MSSSSLKLFGTTGLACGFRDTKKTSSEEEVLNDPDENRTRVTAVKGRCLNRLTTGPL